MRICFNAPRRLRQEKREAWLEIRDEHHETISDILSDEQIEEFKQAMKLKQGQHGKRGHGHRGNGDT